jgi:glycosyltransferase involved in cell wall biosynthesis
VGVLEVIKEFSDPRIKLSLQKNSGVSIARNKGIDEAVGEWICFLDADDWYHPDYLLELNQALTSHPNTAVMATRFVAMPDCLNWSPKVWELSPKKYEPINNLPERWLKGIPFFTSSIAVKRNLLLSMQPCFPPGESSGEDLDLWFRLAEKKPILLLNFPLCVYRTNVHDGLAALGRISPNLHYLQRMAERSKDLPEVLRRSTIKYVLHVSITAARNYARTNRRMKALNLLSQLWKQGIFNRRWWVSILLTCFIPAHLAAEFQSHRQKRTLIHPNSLKLHQRPPESE